MQAAQFVGILNSYFLLKRRGANLSNFWLPPAVLKVWKSYLISFLSDSKFEILLKMKMWKSKSTHCAEKVAKELTQIHHLLPNTVDFCHILSTLKKA